MFENQNIFPYTVPFKITLGPECQRIKILSFLYIVLLLGRGLSRPRLALHVAGRFDKKAQLALKGFHSPPHLYQTDKLCKRSLFPHISLHFDMPNMHITVMIVSNHQRVEHYAKYECVTLL